ncbi:MAG TPA: two-component system response regulator [Nitrospira sp.]|nr:two-component system response regulator [Nitrospira sp.]
MEKPTLFLVEDEEDTALLLTMIMKEEGYDVIHASDGKQAQVKIDALPPPALILLDMGLPHVHGLDLLALIRKKPSWKGVPVVVLTADGDQTNICKAIVAGASDYILKPFKREILLGRLARFGSTDPNRRTA